MFILEALERVGYDSDKWLSVRSTSFIHDVSRSIWRPPLTPRVFAGTLQSVCTDLVQILMVRLTTDGGWSSLY